jgi:hypothetical protein
MNMDTSTDQSLNTARLRRFGLYAAVVLVVFLIGFVPMWLRAQARTNERDAARLAERFTQAENTLASAAIYARRGEYEPAREATSTFFTHLRSELDRPQSAFSASQRESLQPLLVQRDEMITLLARADPAAAERLSDAYLSYRRAMGTLTSPTVAGQ